ncbi:LytR/AlgR family response regulator transcription factor [Shewanella sp.]|uniref:LytR/AlgR family response regulator transcription factor n=1 Tax=Shewanella sp. TaxID=50422 RepID=UPI003A978EFA
MASHHSAMIADDEPVLRFHLKQMLAELWPALTISAMAENGEQALAQISECQPDIIFLDIRMPCSDGLTVAKHLSQAATPPLIVFVTAYDEYAVNAFENNAVDYLLKPVSEERLAHCCQRLQQRLTKPANSDYQQLLQQLTAQLLPPSQKYSKWLKASKGEDIHLVATEHILYIRAEDKYLTLVVNDGGKEQSYLLRQSLRQLLEQLDPEQFWQIHRAVIVNLAQVSKIRRTLTGMEAIVAGHALPISRMMQAKFKG